MKKTNLFKRAIAVFISVLMVVSSLPFTAITASAAEDKEVFGYVNIDPIIYIHGSFNGSVHDISDNHMFDYMMYGDTIADGTYNGECKTLVSANGKTIASVTVTDTNQDLSLKNVSGGVALSGHMGGGYGQIDKNGDSNSTATLKFTFTDNTYEYHKLPVKTNPVATHSLGTIYAYGGRTWLTISKYVVANEILALGSYGQTTNSHSTLLGSHTYGDNMKKVDVNTANFATMYNPHSSVFDTWVTDDWHMYMDTMTNDVADYDKMAGYYAGYSFDKNAARTHDVQSPIATYYLDMSSTNNYGVTYDKSNKNYKIQLLEDSLYFASDIKGSESESKAESVSRVSGNSAVELKNSTVSNTNNVRKSSIGYVDIGGSAAVGTTEGKYTLTYSTKNIDSMRGTQSHTLNFKLIVSDKTTLRNKYNSYIDDLKKENINYKCFSEETWNAFESKLLEVEEYLNDNTDTSSSDALLSDLNSAYNALSHTRSLSTRNANFVNVDSNTLLATTCDTTEECKYDIQTYCTVCDKTISSRTDNVDRLQHSFTGASVHKDANGDVNGYTEYRCVNGCNELGGRVYDKKTDWAAYDAAVVEANANIDNTVKYTADSIREYSTEVAKYTTGVTSGDEKKSQAFIDRMTDGITEAKPILELNQYEVTFRVQYNTNTIEEEKDTVAYGTVKQFSYTPEDGKYIDKWTAENSDSEITSTIATASEIASHTIYSDTIVTVYICDTDKGSADTCSVTLLDKNDKVIGYANVAKDSVITKNGNTLELGNNVVLVAPKYPYYQIMDFVNVDTNATVVSTTVTENIVIKAQYSVSPTITITSSQAVTINGNDTTSYNAKWDERITVTAPNATAWYAGEKLLAYGSTYTFQASADVELSYTTEEVSKTDASSRIDYTGYDSDLKAFRVVVSNCVPDNATIVKQGVKILTSSKTGVTVASSKVIAGTKDYVATKTTGTGKQFMYTIGVADSINTMAVVSYVAYTVTGDSEVHYAYSSTGDATATMISK